MAFPPTLNEIQSNFKNEFVMKSRFFVEIGSPKGPNVGGISIPGLPSFSAGTTSKNNAYFLCDEAEIPGMNILTKEARTYGPDYKVQYQRSYDPVQLSFIITKDFYVRRFFEQWMHFCSDYQTNNMGWYSQVVTDINIYSFSETANYNAGGYLRGIGLGSLPGTLASFGIGANNPFLNAGITAGLNILGAQSFAQLKPYLLHQVVMQNAYPARLDVIPMGWNDTDQIQRQTVNFQYEALYYPSLGPTAYPGTATGAHINKRLEI